MQNSRCFLKRIKLQIKNLTSQRSLEAFRKQFGTTFTKSLFSHMINFFCQYLRFRNIIDQNTIKISLKYRQINVKIYIYIFK